LNNEAALRHNRHYDDVEHHEKTLNNEAALRVVAYAIRR
jgi:hypothetical protein